MRRAEMAAPAGAWAPPPPGGDRFWTAEMVRSRLAEAADTLRRLPIPRGGFPARLRSHWPEVVQESFEAWIASGRDRPFLCPAAPSPQAIDRLDQTLPWLNLLDRGERRIVWARSCGLPWRRLEDIDGRSDRTLRSVYGQAIDRLVSRLNAAGRGTASTAFG